MGKRKPGQNKNLNSAKQLHTVKNGLVKKDKNPKFKNTPGGKVFLINNSKAQNKNTPTQKNFQKDAGVKNNQNLSKNSIKQSKQNSAKNKQNFPKAQNKPKKINFDFRKFEEFDSDSDEEITESEEELDTNIHGKNLQDISDDDDDFYKEMEDSSEVENSEDDFGDNGNDIKGKTIKYKNVKPSEDIKSKKNFDNKDNKNKSSQLNMKDDEEDLYEVLEDSDEDSYADSDDDSSEDDSSEDDLEYDDNDIKGKVVQYKNVRIFEGMKSKKNNDDKDNKNKSDKKNKLFQVMKNDEDDDEGDESDEDDRDIEEDDEYNSEEETARIKGVKIKVEDEVNNDEDESYEDDSDESEEEEHENSTLGLKALLGNSIADEDDDEDFNEEDEDDEDDDISDESEDSEENDNVKEKAAKASNSKDILKGHKQVKKREKELPTGSNTTVVISNLPRDTKEDEINKFFKFGAIDKIYFKSTLPVDPKIKEITALNAMTKYICPEQYTTTIVYIKYKWLGGAREALRLNGQTFKGNHLRIRTVREAMESFDNMKAVFIGNLHYGMDHNTIWKCFSKCGEIDFIHLVRDYLTNQFKGFGFVIFKTRDAAALSLKLNGFKIMKRGLRVKPCLNENEIKNGKKRVSSNNDDNPPKKFKNNFEEPVARKIENEAYINKRQELQKNPKKTKSEEQNSILFQGRKAELKNKKKANKFDEQKKKMAKKFIAKSTKAVKV